MPGILLILPFMLHSQLQYEWSVTQGSPETDPTGSCFIDDQGNLYTTVAFRDTADLDPGPGENWVYVSDKEVFVLNKFSQTGEYIWSSQFKTNGDAAGFITEVKNNHIQLIIYFTDSLIYEHDTPWMTVSPGHHQGVIRMNLDGQIISYSPLSNSLDLYFSNFNTQEDGSILAAGGFEGSVTFASPDSTKTLQSMGEYDAFVARFNASYQIEWITLFAGAGDDFAEAINFDKDGRIYYAVIHDSTIVMNTTQGTVVSPALGEDNSVFGYINPDGSIATAYLFGGALGDQLRNIEIDDAGNMYINGYFEGDVNFQHPSAPPVHFQSLNDSDGFVAKYNPDGVLVWVRIFTSGDYGGVYTMRIHRNTHLYISGGYNGEADLDPGPGTMQVDGGDRGDVFGGKLTTDGDLVWIYPFTSPGDEGIRNFFPGTDDKVFMHGYFYSTLDCDPGPDVAEVATNGGSDLFLIGFTEENVITSSNPQPSGNWSVYPNPATDLVHVVSDVKIESILLYTAGGQPLDVPVTYANDSAVIHIRKQAPGLYMAHLKTATGYAVRPIIKQE